jgi:hypothetical protein
MISRIWEAVATESGASEYAAHFGTMLCRRCGALAGTAGLCCCNGCVMIIESRCAWSVLGIRARDQSVRRASY